MQATERYSGSWRRIRRRWYLSPRVIGWVLGGLAGALALTLPVQDQLGMGGTSTLAATIAAIVWWLVDVGAGATALVYTLVLLAIDQPTHLAFAGWREPGFWFFGAMLFYGVAMMSTGLDSRLAHAVLANVRPSYRGLLSAFAVMGFVLALLIPTMRVRMAILTSISWSVSQAVGRPRHSRESTLLALVTWVVAVVPGLAVPAVGLGAGKIRDVLAPEPLGGLSWLEWVGLFALPAMLLTGAALVLAYAAFRPRKPLAFTRNYFRHRQLRLGKPTWRERTALIIFLASLVAWITKEWHGIPESHVAIAGAVLLIATGALPVRALVQWPLWSTLLFFSTLFAVPELLKAHGITDWLDGYLEPVIHGGMDSLVIAMVFLISARSSSAWAPMSADASLEGPERRRPRGRVSMKMRDTHATFIYVHEVRYGRSRGGRRLWAARVERSLRGKSGPGALGREMVSAGSGASSGGRSGLRSRVGPWRRL